MLLRIITNKRGYLVAPYNRRLTKMIKATYKQMFDLLSHGRAFKGNSVTAVSVCQGDEITYTVYSYDTIIYQSTCNRYTDLKKVYFNNYYYSPTTSKIQNMLIRVFDLNNGITKRE